MMRQLSSLARGIEKEWLRRGGRTAAFTAAAVKALEKTGPIDPGELVSWTLRTRDFPEECNPFGDAGPPAFTVFRGAGFVLNLYLYATPDLFIHDHSFAGAFVNLTGESLHCAFRFGIENEPGPGIQAGSLKLGEVRLLRPGMVYPLVPGPASTHRVWHLGRPTIVLVARTIEGARGLVQYQYDAPGLAARIVRPAPYGPEIPLDYKKRSKMFQFLLQTQPAAARGYLREMILAGGVWTAVAHTLDQWDYLVESRLLPSLLEELQAKYGAWTAVLPAVARAKALHRSIAWESLTEDGPRLLLSLLLTYSQREPIAAWISKLHPGRDVDETIVSFLRDAFRAEALDVSLDDSGLAILRALLRGHRGRQLVEALRREFKISEEKPLLAAARRIRQIEILKPLFTAAPGE
jgi:hypothetical protein